MTRVITKKKSYLIGGLFCQQFTNFSVFRWFTNEISSILSYRILSLSLFLRNCWFLCLFGQLFTEIILLTKGGVTLNHYKTVLKWIQFEHVQFLSLQFRCSNTCAKWKWLVTTAPYFRVEANLSLESSSPSPLYCKKIK